MSLGPQILTIHKDGEEVSSGDDHGRGQEEHEKLSRKREKLVSACGRLVVPRAQIPRVCLSSRRTASFTLPHPHLRNKEEGDHLQGRETGVGPLEPVEIVTWIGRLLLGDVAHHQCLFQPPRPVVEKGLQEFLHGKLGRERGYSLSEH